MLLSGIDDPACRGPCADVVVADSEAALIRGGRGRGRSPSAGAAVGGGSNLLISDVGFEGRVVLVLGAGVGDGGRSGDGGRRRILVGVRHVDGVRVARWRGGRSPVSRVRSERPRSRTSGRTGAEVADTIRTVRAFDRAASAQRSD